MSSGLFGNIYIYKHNGTQYNLFQTIITSSNADDARMTEDNQYITVSDGNIEQVSRYYFDEDTNQF